MLTLSIGKSTISSLLKILRLLSHTGSLPLIMLQLCSSALERIWGAVFGMLCTSFSQMVFNIFSCHVDLSPRAKIQEYTCLILRVGILLGIDLAPREYTVYEELWDRVLNCPYCHAALLPGNIVWCLALEPVQLLWVCHVLDVVQM